MASRAGAIRAGRAFVEMFVDDTGVQRGLNRLSARFRAWGSTISRFGAQFFAVGTAGITAFVPAIKAASDLQETMSKFDVVFGSNAKGMKAWGDSYAKEVGRSKGEIASFLAGTQDLLVPIGLDPSAARETSKQITQLAVDLASFNNMADADTLRDLHAALTGSGEVMKKYGVVVNETAVKQELLNQGIDKASATEAQKAMARFAIILRGTTAAQGDAIRTLWSFANQWKRLNAEVTDTNAEIGGSVLPVVTELVSRVSSAVSAVARWAKEHPEAARAVFFTAAAVTALGAALLAVGVPMMIAGSILASLASVIGSVVAAVSALGIKGIAAVAAFAAGAAAGTALFATMAYHAFNWAEALSVVKGAWEGVVAAISAGDIEKAGQIAFQALKVAWLELVRDMREAWSYLHQDVSEVVTAAKGLVMGDGGAGVAEQIQQHQAERREIRRELEGEQEKLRRLIDEAKSLGHPGDLPFDGRPAFGSAAFSRQRFAALTSGAQQFSFSARRHESGTISSLSERMFGSLDGGVLKRLDNLNRKAGQMNEHLQQLSRNAAVYMN